MPVKLVLHKGTYSVRQAATYLGVSHQTVLLKIHAKKIPAMKVGHQYVIQLQHDLPVLMRKQ